MRGKKQTVNRIGSPENEKPVQKRDGLRKLCEWSLTVGL
jgi:hypothetical protein